jgi:hygromycin-B 7''-O-kinase
MSGKPDFVRYETSKDAAAYDEKLSIIGQMHSLPVTNAQLSPGGVNATFHLSNKLVVKFFSASAEGWRHEARILEHLSHQTQVPTPKLLHQGEVNGTPYVVMTEVPGVPLSQVWEELPRHQAIAVREQIGDVTRSLHQQSLLEESWPHTVLENLPANTRPSWPGFLQTRRERIVARQREKGCPEEWLRAMPSFLDDVAVHQDDKAPLVLLHGELNANHIYVQKQGETWNVSGLIDFQASSTGTAKHEMSHVGFFFVGMTANFCAP